MPNQQSIQTDNQCPDHLLFQVIRRRNERLVQGLFQEPRPPRLNRLLGCMLGLAVGDILGCPVEGMRFREIQARYGTIDRLLFPGYRRHWRMPGLHSDDTQQALAVLVAIHRAQRKAGNPIDGARTVARELAALYVEGLRSAHDPFFGCWRGTGKNFRRIVEGLEQYHEDPRWPYNCGAPSAGLGAVMRIPPAGLLLENPTTLAHWVAHITFITHTDPLATVSAGSIARGCQILGQTDPRSFQADHFLTTLYQEVRQLEQTLHLLLPIGIGGSFDSDLGSALIAGVSELVDEPPNIAIRRIAERTQQLTGQRHVPTAGFAPAGVAACLYFFLHNILDPRKALLTAINAGGDTDTIGAIVGALCGALYGMAAYRDLLPDLFALDLIVGQTRATIDPASPNSFDLIGEEIALTKMESSFRKLMRRLQ